MRRIISGGALHYDFRHVGDATASHPLCSCETKLRRYISELIADAEVLQALYANPQYRQRPAYFAPDASPDMRRWRLTTYRAVIELMYKEDLDFDTAVAIVDADTTPFGNYTPNQSDIYVPTPDDIIPTAGETIRENGICKVNITKGQNECYAPIAYGAINAHESVHLADCEAGDDRTNEIEDITGDIDDHGDEEVAAHDAEIAYLRSWIPTNCYDVENIGD